MTTETILKTQEGATRWLNNPKIIATIDRGDRILIFFREKIQSYTAESNSEWINRVASICKSDAGSKHLKVFMSFVKIQIRCAQYKETTFSFDTLVSVSYFVLCPRINHVLNKGNRKWRRKWSLRNFHRFK